VCYKTVSCDAVEVREQPPPLPPKMTFISRLKASYLDFLIFYREDTAVENPTQHAQPVKIVVVGGVAGGMSFAARARRLSQTATITVFE
jgi:hypothetical protein